jgi:hypothetical protein
MNEAISPGIEPCLDRNLTGASDVKRSRSPQSKNPPVENADWHNLKASAIHRAEHYRLG